MTAKPRRYVRVRILTHHGTLASWGCRLCITLGGYWNAEIAHREATKHTRECEAVRIATERDQLRAERDQWRTKAHELAAELLLRDERKETPC